MHVPVLRQTGACCHGAAVLDKRQRERVFRKNGYRFCDQNPRKEQSALRQ
jgi:hypothetical protein